jgi:hypothetical protein
LPRYLLPCAPARTLELSVWVGWRQDFSACFSADFIFILLFIPKMDRHIVEARYLASLFRPAERAS